VIQIAVAFGLLGMKKWPWIMALIGVELTVLQGLVGIIGGSASAIMCGSIGLILPVIILVYLLRPDIRFTFGARTSASCNQSSWRFAQAKVLTFT